ncbi:MAG: FtsX-like permease family protein [Lachnospiraceae bacterium]|nr:FtsX-like permease family protein [Lachnospiraceae bacterium]
MKSYLSLIPISAKVRKRQNRMTILCITIAVLLVTTIFSMADMAIRMEKARMIKEQGSWHIMLKEPSDQQISEISARPDVAASSRYDGLNYDLSQDYTIKGKTCVIAGGDPEILTEIYDDLTQGSYPAKKDEILLSNRAKEMLSVEIGDTVTLHTPNGDFDYTISAFGGDVTISDDADVVGASLSWEAFQTLAGSVGSKPAPVFFVRFKDHTPVRKVISDLRQTYGFTDDTLSENTALLGLTGLSSDSYVMGMYLVAATLFVLVLAAGVFMIAGSLNSQTAQRTQFFGMLRCIGASKAQIMHIVRLEALCWCKTAIPIGITAGIVCTWLLCALLRFGTGAEFVLIPLFGISAVGIGSGVAVGILTVLLSSISPARRAAGVSPVAAVTGNLSEKKSSVHPIRKSFLKIETVLGIHHAVSSPKNLLLMTGSFALSIILILSFSVLIQWVNMALTPLKPWAPDVFYSSPANECEIGKDLVKKIEEKPYVERAFGRMYQSLSAEYEEKSGQIDLISYEEQQFEWAKKDLIEGDIETVLSGRGVLTVFDQSNLLHTGDTIRLGNADLTVAGVLKDSPFDTSDHPTVICSEKLFYTLTGKDSYSVVDVQLSKKATQQNINELHALAGEEYLFYDRLDQNKDTQNTYFMFCLFAYGFLAVVTLITVIHTINSISMSVSARTKQYGAMRAVGMDHVQIRKMIITEASAYTTLGLFAGCILGLPLHHFLYSQMITNYWGTAWQFPGASIAGILSFLVLTSLLAPCAPAKRICRMAVSETINEL